MAHSKKTRFNLVAIAAVASGLLLSTAATAIEQVPADRKISRLSVYSDHALIIIDRAHNNSDGCTAGAASIVGRINLDAGSTGKSMLAAAMLAKAQGSDVGFGINGCSSNQVPLIYRFDVR